MMSHENLRQMSNKELLELAIDKGRERFNLLIQKSLGQLVKTDQLQKLRTDIARINSVISERYE